MLKIIKGRKYNTETAHKVGCTTEKAAYGDVDKTLYRKRTGEYFLAAVHSYTYEDGNPDYIKPLNAGEANEWAQEHLDAATYEAEFGAVLENEESVATTLNLPRSEYDKLKRLALNAGMPVSKYIAKVISKL